MRKWTLLVALLPLTVFAQPQPTTPAPASSVAATAPAAPAGPVKVTVGPAGITSVTPSIVGPVAPVVVVPPVKLPTPINPDEIGAGGLFSLITDAAKGGNWKLVVVLVLIVLVWLTRKFGGMIPGPLGVSLKSDVGGVVTAFLWAFLGTLGAAMLGGVPLDFSLVSGAILFGFGSMGGWVALKKLTPQSWRDKMGWLFGESKPPAEVKP